jgi:hypothetical protein
MKPEVERCGEEAALCSATRLDGVKEEEEEEVLETRCRGRRCRGRGVEGEASGARCQGRGCRGRGVSMVVLTYDAKTTSHKSCDASRLLMPHKVVLPQG